MENKLSPDNDPKGNKIVLGHLLIFFSILFFGLNIPVLKLLLPHWMSFNDATVFRLLGATTLFWIASCFIKNDPIDKKDWWIIILSGMIGLFSFFYFFSLSVQLSSPIDLSIILTLPPIIVVLFSAIIYKTPISGLKILGVLLSIAGALLIILLQHHGSDTTRSMKGNIYGVISAICYALYILAIKKPSEKYKSITFLRWVFLFACLPSIPLLLGSFKDALILHQPEPEPVLLLLFVVFFPTFISYLLIPLAIRRIGHELVSMYQYLIPVVATVTAILMKIDKLQWDQPIAAVIILTGVYLTSLANKRSQKTK
ncbi:MAG: DMT family transporter [Bacteroidales bacterium]